MKPKFETLELLAPTGEVIELKVVKNGLAQARPEPVDRHKPAWLKATLPTGAKYQALKRTVEELRLHTVCQEALCPNVGECWTHGTLTVMILGSVCTRACKFCAVDTGNPRGSWTPRSPSGWPRPSAGSASATWSSPAWTGTTFRMAGPPTSPPP